MSSCLTPDRSPGPGLKRNEEHRESLVAWVITVCDKHVEDFDSLADGNVLGSVLRIM